MAKHKRTKRKHPLDQTRVTAGERLLRDNLTTFALDHFGRDASLDHTPGGMTWADVFVARYHDDLGNVWMHDDPCWIAEMVGFDGTVVLHRVLCGARIHPR